MFAGMTSAEQLGAICLVIIIGAPVLALLGVMGALAYGIQAPPSEQSFNSWLNSYDTPARRAVTAMGRAAAAPAFLAPDPAATLADLSDDAPTPPATLPFEPIVPEVFPSLIRLTIPAPATTAATAWRGAEHYRVTLADLIEGSRYVVPIVTRPVSTEPRHYSGVVDTAAPETIGRHRALPALVAA